MHQHIWQWAKGKRINTEGKWIKTKETYLHFWEPCQICLRLITPPLCICKRDNFFLLSFGFTLTCFIALACYFLLKLPLLRRQRLSFSPLCILKHMSPFIIADAFDAKQFNITMIRYKFESLVSNLIDGLSSFMWSASRILVGRWTHVEILYQKVSTFCPRFIFHEYMRVLW